MKRFSILFVTIMLISSCSPAPNALPSSTPEATSTRTPTASPSSIPTLTPTITPTPTLPETVRIELDPAIPQNIAELVNVTVNQAYWFYVGLGCSTEFDYVKVLAHESAGGEVEGIVVGWDDLTTISSNMDVRISHEMAHAMCQLAIKQDPDTGEEMIWLLEGIANYFSGMERLIHTGSLSAVRQTVLGHQVGQAKWVTDNGFCNYPLKSIEEDAEPKGTGRFGVLYPEFGGVAETAAALLANTSPNGVQALINYYKFLRTTDSDSSFAHAFGRTKDEFYRQFSDECTTNFPSLKVLAAPFDVPVTFPLEPTPTLDLPKDSIRVQGKVLLNDANTAFSDFVIDFCDTITSACLPGIAIQNDGTFNAAIPIGKYKIRIHRADDGHPVGVYTRRGLVTDWNCADVVRVFLNQEVNLTIDFTLVGCPS